MLIMDEPLASLDDLLKDHILAYLDVAVAEWDMPTLFVTHSQAEVRRAAEWVIVIDKGRVVCDGTPNEALAQPGPLAWSNAAGPTNLLRIERMAAVEDHIVAYVSGQTVFLPITKLPERSPAFLQFRPADVAISRNDVTGLSVRNHLSGRICQMLTVENTVFVAIDIGQIIWAEITPQAAVELQLAPDAPVTCLLKAHSLTLVQ
jgi:molybdate transport system ATP-binding protein